MEKVSKLFTEGLLKGEHYERLRRCVCISILGFDLDEHPEYHRIYRLRDETGREFSDMLEVHVIELNKPLSGSGRMDEWIQLFNAQTEEELDMLEAKTKNIGIIEAVREVRDMRLGRVFKALHDAHMKEIRDRNARDDYVRVEGRASGLTEGLAAGEDRMNRLILSLIQDVRQEDIEKAAKDKEYWDRLYKEYGIE